MLFVRIPDKIIGCEFASFCVCHSINFEYKYMNTGGKPINGWTAERLGMPEIKDEEEGYEQFIIPESDKELLLAEMDVEWELEKRVTNPLTPDYYYCFEDGTYFDVSEQEEFSMAIHSPG